ncbi:FGGY-family carbohydrate kinase [Streptomyces pseudovenezuelae]|uniref:Sugar (Pentulose or hexulose) kinase n=1 Tax=Streptomyces pseudovenezuelae TaxID=67350 RepID=A0ABT6LHE8_9ACTN|nr:FGGY family carbohydrate kinase [Streptomyces pseudovenezuelae]MDH6215733.1 sugar (pentulose or hexulose) kinase [Streptomyces pseudovenezuelae]
MAADASEAWLGVDLGTQSVRVLLVTADGTVLGRGSAPLAGRRDGVRHEQDPEEWWQALRRASRAALADRLHVRVGGLAVCGTSGTVLLTDGTGRPVSPALMYDDSRATTQAARARRAGLAVQDTWALPKVLWLVGEYGGEMGGGARTGGAGAAGETSPSRRPHPRPHLHSRPHPHLRLVHPPRPPRLRLAHQPDLVVARLIGEPPPADSSHALKTGYDLEAGTWPEAALAELGLPDELFPDVVRPGTRLGEVTSAAAEATGIPAGTPVIAGMTDGCAAQIAAGALRPGSWNSVLGTTLVLKGASVTPVRDETGVVYNHRAPDGTWLPGGASSVGAGVLTAAFSGADPAAMDARAAAYEPSGAVTYPLVSPGERFPFLAPAASAIVLGEPADTADLWASLLQGVAFAERLCLDYLDHLGAPLDGPLTFTGGAARSAYWNQLRVDVLGRPARVPHQTEPALGMAALAAHGTGQGPLPEVAERMVRIHTVLEPDPARTALFAGPYARLINELTARGWLPAPVAAHAHARLKGTAPD